MKTVVYMVDYNFVNWRYGNNIVDIDIVVGHRKSVVVNINCKMPISTGYHHAIVDVDIIFVLNVVFRITIIVLLSCIKCILC